MNAEQGATMTTGPGFADPVVGAAESAVERRRQIGFLIPDEGERMDRAGSPRGAADHGGGVDAARARYGGARADWLDLSTGIDPVPYPAVVGAEAWGALPDTAAAEALVGAARTFWRVPEGAAVLAAPGASALIARIPHLWPAARVRIDPPTYNEHGRSFVAAGWTVTPQDAPVRVLVHPNNPDGRLAQRSDLADVTIVDESFCDTMPAASLIAEAARPGVVVLKSFGKFWGLAGLRLGFAIGDPVLLARLAQALGPWPVSGPALEIGARALGDEAWAVATRERLARDARRLDDLTGLPLIGGTDLFRLYDTGDARALQHRLAERRIWSRVFPWSPRAIRLGLPGPDGWDRLAAAFG